MNRDNAIVVDFHIFDILSVLVYSEILVVEICMAWHHQHLEYSSTILH